MIHFLPDLFPTAQLLAVWVGFLLVVIAIFLNLPKRIW